MKMKKMKMKKIAGCSMLILIITLAAGCTTTEKTEATDNKEVAESTEVVENTEVEVKDIVELIAEAEDL